MSEWNPESFNLKQKALYQTFLENDLPLTEGVKAQILALASKKPGRKPKEVALKTQAQVISDRNEELANELILRSLERPGSIRLVKCRECGNQFGTNYYSVVYCSTECRTAALHEKGLDYDGYKLVGERYIGYRPPAILAPADLVKLREWAAIILQQPVDVAPQPNADSLLQSSLPDL